MDHDRTPAFADTLAVFDRVGPPGAPLTTSEVAAELDVSRRSTYDRLQRLVDQGALETKKVGARGRVWWRPTTGAPVGATAEARRDGRERDGYESELAEVFERVDDGFYGLDENLRFTVMNGQAEKLLGLDAASAIGNDIRAELPVTDRFEAALHEALDSQEPVFQEDFYEPLDGWFENVLYPSETGITVYFWNVSERKERERELARFRRAVEASGHAIYMTDPDGRITYANPAFESVTGYEAAEAVGRTPTLLQSGAHDEAYYRDLWETILAGDVWSEEIVDRRKSGERYYAEQTIAPVTDEYGGVDRFVAVQKDVTERRERERELERQRRHLAALDDLNAVVRDITDAIIDRSSREEIETAVCERLAASDSYEFAWIGAVDAQSREARVRAAAGVDGDLDGVTVPVAPEDESNDDPTGTAILAREMQVTHDVQDGPGHGPWRDRIEDDGFRSSAAIPILHEGTLYGVLNVYSARPGAFTGDEREVVGQLGEVVGHAIAAVDRKRALMNPEIVELEFHVPDVLDEIDLAVDVDGRLTLDHAVPAGDDVYLVYGTANGSGVDLARGLVEALPYWDAVTVLDETDGIARLECRLVEPPVLSVVASLGGYVDEAIVEDGDYYLRIHVTPSVDVRLIVDAVEDVYPTVRPTSKRQMAREGDPFASLSRVFHETVTDRQRSAIEAAYFAGYFEWPRESSGEAVADSLGVSAPTFHQHVRKAQKQLLGAILEE